MKNKKLLHNDNSLHLEQIIDELYRKTVELDTLKEISELTCATLDLDLILQRIVKIVCEKLHADNCSVFLLDKEDKLVLRAAIGIEKEQIGKLKLKVGEGIAGYTVKTGEAVSVPHSDMHPNYIHIPGISVKGTYSMLSIPLKREHIILGAICLQTILARHYTPDELNFLTTIASQITGAIRNIQLYEEEKRALDEVSRLYKIGKAISSTLQLDRLLKEITKAGAEILGARGCILRLLKEDRKSLEIEEVFGLREDEHLPEVLNIGESIAGKVASTGESMLVPHIPSNRLLKSRFQKNVLSLVCVPIISKGLVIGTISVFDKGEGSEQFNQDDERLLAILASQAAICIENARLFEAIQRSEQSMRELREQLVRVERLAAMGELSAKVAHEIRNPLVSIGGFARKVYEQFPEGVQGKEHLRIVIQEVSNLERILHEILEFSSPTLPKMKTMDIHQVIEQTLHMIREQCIQKKISIITKYDALHSIVKMNPEQIKQAFLNLFNNSIDAMEEIKGELKIHTFSSPVEKGKPDRITVALHDNGCGIDPENLSHIFDPFFTSKVKGSGLGLAITHKILIAHNATINVESRMNLGTMFLIEFPLYQAKE